MKWFATHGRQDDEDTELSEAAVVAGDRGCAINAGDVDEMPEATGSFQLPRFPALSNETPMDRPITPSRIDTDALERETGFGWGWFVVLGVTLIVLGAVAILSLPPAGTVSVYAVGVVMLIGAIAQLGTTLLAAGLSGTGLFVLSAVLYGAAGTLAIVNPTLTVTPLTLLLALLLICSGATRIRLTSVMPSMPGWGWVAVSGFGSIVTGLAFFHLALAKTVWLLGMALAVDLTLQGAMALAFGVALKANVRARFLHR